MQTQVHVRQRVRSTAETSNSKFPPRRRTIGKLGPWSDDNLNHDEQVGVYK